ncbi:MAG: hypothetical protein Tsb0021_09470 [Chlamydiales bacterium]
MENNVSNRIHFFDQIKFDWEYNGSVVFNVIEEWTSLSVLRGKTIYVNPEESAYYEIPKVRSVVSLIFDALKILSFVAYPPYGLAILGINLTLRQFNRYRINYPGFIFRYNHENNQDHNHAVNDFNNHNYINNNNHLIENLFNRENNQENNEDVLNLRIVPFNEDEELDNNESIYERIEDFGIPPQIELDSKKSYIEELLKNESLTKEQVKEIESYASLKLNIIRKENQWKAKFNTFEQKFNLLIDLLNQVGIDPPLHLSESEEIFTDIKKLFTVIALNHNEIKKNLSTENMLTFKFNLKILRNDIDFLFPSSDPALHKQKIYLNLLLYTLNLTLNINLPDEIYNDEGYHRTLIYTTAYYLPWYTMPIDNQSADEIIKNLSLFACDEEILSKQNKENGTFYFIRLSTINKTGENKFTLVYLQKNSDDIARLRIFFEKNNDTLSYIIKEKNGNVYKYDSIASISELIRKYLDLSQEEPIFPVKEIYNNQLLVDTGIVTEDPVYEEVL